MSDLSRLLEDLYRDETDESDDGTVLTSWAAVPPSDAPSVVPAPTPSRAPSWSSDEALDEAFASWVPGPGLDASPAERAMVAAAHDEKPFEPVPTVDAWTLDAPVVIDRARWSPSDDDILPARKGRRRRR